MSKVQGCDEVDTAIFSSLLPVFKSVKRQSHFGLRSLLLDISTARGDVDSLSHM